MSWTVPQIKLEIACKETTGKFKYDKKNGVVTCSFEGDKFNVEIDKNDIAYFNTKFGSAKIHIKDVSNIFKKGIPKSGQGIHVRGNKAFGDIGPTGWSVSQYW